MKTIFIFLATAAAPYADAKVCRFPPPIDDQVVMLESLTMNYDGMVSTSSFVYPPNLNFLFVLCCGFFVPPPTSHLDSTSPYSSVSCGEWV